MNILSIINKKRIGEELTLEEIRYAVNGYLEGIIPDYQMSSLLMAIVINGMNEKETYYMTKVMLESGDIIDLSMIEGIKIDKHSTGGVGDKVTLILAPLLASMNLKVAKMSGRGLGHTGGTIDKLESIPGFKVDLSLEEFIDQVKKIGVCIVSQTGNLVPADKKIYALRDVTGTVSSIPLIAASIMSKKLTSGADNIIIDVKVGSGSLLEKVEDARKLSDLMVSIGKMEGKKVVCVLTNMDEPLGNAVGNSLEVLESIEILEGKGPCDLRNLIIELGSLSLVMNEDISLEDARKMVIKHLDEGFALKKFKELVDLQGGNLSQVKVSEKVLSIKSEKSGFVEHIDALMVGELARGLGAGRLKKEDEIDFGVGLVLSVKVGDYVNPGDELMKIYYNDKNINVVDALNCFKITDEKVKPKDLIIEVIS